MYCENLKKSFFFALIALFAIYPAVAGAQSKKDVKRSNQLVDLGNRDFRQKNYRAAVDKYAEAVAIVPKNAAAHFWKGYAHYYLKENDEALAALDSAASNGYAPVEIYKVRWYVNFEKKNYDAALADVSAALKVEPANQMLLRASGDINYEKENYRDSLVAYQLVAAQAPNDAELFLRIAKVNQRLGDYGAQAKAAEGAIAKRTQSLSEALAILGDAYQRQGKMTEAAQVFRKALDAKPDVRESYRTLSEIYRSENRYDDAIDILKRGLRQFPLDGEFYTDLSWYYSLAGRNDEAVQAAQAGIKILPDRYMAYTNLCRAYNDVKRPELAIGECNKALKLNPNDGETHFYLGRAYDLVGKSADAMRNYLKAVNGLISTTKGDPTNSDGFYLLGNAYFADSKREKAIEAYRKCLELSPKYVKARYNLGIIQVLQKNKAGALEQYNSLSTMDPVLAGKLKTEIDKL